jgi:hypothetical protein
MEVLSVIIQALIAIGTIAVAVVAIWGDWFRSKFDPLELTIVKPTRMGDPTTFSPPMGSPAGTPSTRVMFYHLTVVNRRRWTAAENCRVMLVGLLRRDASLIFQPVPMPVPQQFVWAPAEITPPSITITREQVLDLGYISENGGNFVPCLYITPNNFQAMLVQMRRCAFSFRSKRLILPHRFMWSKSPGMGNGVTTLIR